MEDHLPHGFLKEIFSGVSAHTGTPIPLGFDQRIDDFSEYAEKLPLTLYTKQLTRHIGRKIKETLRGEKNQEYKIFYKTIKKDLIIALQSYAKTQIYLRRSKRAKQIRRKKIVDVVKEFLAQHNGNTRTFENLIKYSEKTQYPIRGDKLRHYLNNHYSPPDNTIFKEILGDASPLMDGKKFEKEIRRTDEDFTKQINTLLAGRNPGGITINDIKSFHTPEEATYGIKLYHSLYLKHGVQWPDYLGKYIGEEKAKLYPIIRKIDLEYEHIKARLRPFLLNMIELGQTIITPSLIRRYMIKEYVRIRRHCRYNEKVDRFTVLFKCIDEDMLPQIKFHYRNRDLLYGEITSFNQLDDISDFNHGKGFTDDLATPEDLLIEKEERMILEKLIEQLPSHLQHIIKKFRNEEEVNPDLLQESIQQLKKMIQ